ncbi:MAG: hypothetical protein J3Q66DRAFT_444451 [Benniella sp.]|nr:MAG: hypothetical protein J3Q66DRAFT_444451 [Benniella sp.]
MDKDTAPNSTDALGSSRLTDKEGSQGRQEEQDTNQATAQSHPKLILIPESTDVDPSSSSEGEDLAKLEEINRLKARLEAKLQAKQLRKMAKSTGADDTQQTSSNVPGSEDTTSRGRSVVKCDPIVIPSESSTLNNTSAPLNDSYLDVTTPTTSITPLISPGFRTPSPPHRSRIMSPPSGASSRKRQHSPSPLPKASSISVHRMGYGSRTPTPKRHLRFPEGANTPEKASSFDSKMKLEMEGRNTWTEDPYHDPLDDDLDSAILDALLEDEFDQASEAPVKSTVATTHSTTGDDKETAEENGATDLPTAKAGGHGDSNHSLTEVVEAQRQKREAEIAVQKAPKSTFCTIAAESEPLSAEESTRLRHTLDFDPLTGLRIRDRITSCEDVATMTHKMRIIPLKDNDQIRENSAKRPTAGLLPSSSSSSGGAALSTGRLGSIANNPAIASDSKLENWIIAGVVGAKSKQRMTTKKVRYSHFQLSDLRNGAVNAFMFRSVMEKHYNKLEVGQIVAIMNPKVLPQAEHVGTLGVEIEHPDCLLVIGTSTDYGVCEAVKLNGENCGKILDKRGSAYCNHHIMMAMNKRRNQRGSLIVSTSSVYDLDKNTLQAGSATLPRKIGGDGQSNSRPMTRGFKETTYIFDDGGIGTSSMMDRESPKKGSRPSDSGLSAFLMSQNNPGGQYLRQAKASKDVAWAKDITSPKTPTSSSELFPAEMIRRMGYDPVSGKFVPGSPKRTNDDLEARERSIRLLAERVKSPPAPMQSLSAISPARRRTIEVKGTTRSIAQPRSNKLSTAKGGQGGHGAQGDMSFTSPRPPEAPVTTQNWVNLDDGSSEEDIDRGSPLLSLSHQRAKILQDTRARQSRLLAAAAAATAPAATTTSAPTTSATAEHSTKIPQGKLGVPTAMMILKRKPTTQSSSINPAVPSSATSGTTKGPSTRLDTPSKPPTAVSGADTLLHAPEASATDPRDNASQKKPRFVDFSDSE